MLGGWILLSRWGTRRVVQTGVHEKLRRLLELLVDLRAAIAHTSTSSAKKVLYASSTKRTDPFEAHILRRSAEFSKLRYALSRLGASVRPLPFQSVLIPDRYRQPLSLEELSAIGGDVRPRAPDAYMQITPALDALARPRCFVDLSWP